MIDQILKKLLFNYYLVFVLLVITAIAGYFIQPLMHMDRLSNSGIIFQSIGILVVLAFIPLALKLHSLKVKSLQAITDENIMLNKYLYWSNIRLVLIAIPLLINILLYFITQDNSMLFGSAIAAVALIFCKPLKGKIEKELNLLNEEEHEENKEDENQEEL